MTWREVMKPISHSFNDKIGLQMAVQSIRITYAALIEHFVKPY